MKQLALAALIAALAAPVAAQQQSVPQLEATMIAQDSAGSAQGIFVPIFAILLVLAASISASE